MASFQLIKVDGRDWYSREQVDTRIADLEAQLSRARVALEFIAGAKRYTSLYQHVQIARSVLSTLDVPVLKKVFAAS